MIMLNVTALPNQLALIIVTYQSGQHIQACLTSLPLAEPHRRLHLLLVDNASRDDTREQIQAALESFPVERTSYKLIYNEANLGFTHAVNQALAHAPQRTPVLFLNPDTELPPQSLAVLLEKLYADEGAGVVAPQLRYPANANSTDEAIQASCRHFPAYADLFFEFTGLARLFPHSPLFNRWKMGGFDHRTRRAVDQPQGACLLARPEVITQVGLWDELFPLFFSDVDWCRRVWQAGWKIYFEPEVTVFHEQGASVKQTRPRAIWSSHVSFWRYFRKWRASWRDEILSLVVAPVLLLAALVRIVLCNVSAVTQAPPEAAHARQPKASTFCA